VDDNLDELTEIEKLDPTRVSGVQVPANGTPFLLIKAEDTEEHEDEKQHAADTDSSEADAIEEMVTKAAGVLASLEDMAQANTLTEDVLLRMQEYLNAFPKDVIEKAKLRAKERNALPDSDFAYISSSGKRKLPVNDPSHTRNAIARFNQTQFDSPEAKAKARRKVLAAARRFHIDVSSEGLENMGEKKSKKGKVRKSPGVPSFSLKTPKVRGAFESGKSGLKGPETAGLIDNTPDPSFFEGGRTLYRIPAEVKINDHKRPLLWPPQKPEKVRIAKASSIKVVPNAVENGSENVGSPAWERQDAASLQRAAQGIVAIMEAVHALRQREVAEAKAGHEGDWADAAELSGAKDSLASALTALMDLSQHESQEAEERAIKAVSTLMKSGGVRMDENVVTLDEAQFAQLVKERADEQTAKLKKKMKKLRKKNKALAKKLKGMREQMPANAANNGGNISGAQMEREVTGEKDADDLESMAEHVDPQYIAKSKKALAKQLKKLQKAVEGLPRSGGPVLDGTLRAGVDLSKASGAQAGDEFATVLAKAQELEAKLAATNDPVMRDQISRDLTLQRLKLGHLKGEI